MCMCSEPKTGKCHSHMKIAKDGNWATIVVSKSSESFWIVMLWTLPYYWVLLFLELHYRNLFHCDGHIFYWYRHQIFPSKFRTLSFSLMCTISILWHHCMVVKKFWTDMQVIMFTNFKVINAYQPHCTWKC